MSDSLKIRSYRREYSVDFVDEYLPALKKQVRQRDVVIIDKNIFDLYPDIAEVAQEVCHRVIKPIEEAKSFHALHPIIDNLLEGGITKTDRIIAIGGGIIQDIAAFISSILFRGIEWVFFPTNLLSQADSCIGSKTSINFGAYKNQLGGFYPPHKIVIATAFLSTLPEREILSGLGEMMHYFCVSGEGDFAWAKDRLAVAVQEKKGFDELIRRSLSIKKALIEIDEFDEGPRNVFNYGHSFAHALESVTNYAVPHGIAVCFGMDLANFISVKLGLIPNELRNEIQRSLVPVWEKTELDLHNLDPFFTALKRDKKNEGTNIKVILTKSLGKMFKTTLVLDDPMKELIRKYFADKQWEKAIWMSWEN